MADLSSGQLVVVLLAFDLVVKAAWTSTGGVLQHNCLIALFFRTGGVSYCICATARLWFYWKAPVPQPGRPAMCLGACCAVLRVEWLSLSPRLWSGSWAEKEGNVWQLHSYIPLLSLLQISPHNVV